MVILLLGRLSRKPLRSLVMSRVSMAVVEDALAIDSRYVQQGFSSAGDSTYIFIIQVLNL